MLLLWYHTKALQFSLFGKPSAGSNQTKLMAGHETTLHYNGYLMQFAKDAKGLVGSHKQQFQAQQSNRIEITHICGLHRG